MNVTEETKKAYEHDVVKHLDVYFPGLETSVDGSRIDEESMLLSEAVLDDGNVEFVGCIASRFEITVCGITQNIKGQRIDVSIKAGDTEEIPLFHGIVDSAMRQTNRNYKKIVAYDVLYTKGNVDVASWYNSLSFPITLRDFRYSLFDYLGITQVERTLPNDSVTINKELAPTTLRAITVIKSICQINGAFGIINRYGNFEYRILTDLLPVSGAYPGLTLYPPFYPGVGVSTEPEEGKSHPVAYYKKVDYEEYSVKPVEKVTIRQSESDAGVSYGDGTNNYIIQGNMFAINQPESVLLSVARSIYGSIGGVEFTPFKSQNNGYPFLECGVDGVSYYTYDFEASAKAKTEDVYTEKVFYIFSRELSGIQALNDSYSAEGEEYQREFITDLRAQVETLKTGIASEVSTQVQLQVKEQVTAQIKEKTYTKQEIDDKVGNQLNVESVPYLPTNPDNNTIYLIQGEVTVS